MDATKCEALITAAEMGSFTAAARALGYTQSGITRMVRALEKELGFPLFSRAKEGVSLTDNGRSMLPLMRDVVRSDRAARELGAEIRGLVTGSLTVGSYYSVSSMWMPKVLKRFRARFPGIRVAVVEGGNSDIRRMLVERSVDVCLCGEPVAETPCDWIPLHRDRIVAWLPSDHPRAHDPGFPIANLAGEPFIHTSPGHDTDQDRLLASEGLDLDVRYTTHDGFTTYSMVEAGLGVSFNQQLISRRWHGDVAEVPLEPARYVSLGLAVPDLEEVSPAARRFIDCVREMCDILVSDEEGPAGDKGRPAGDAPC